MKYGALLLLVILLAGAVWLLLGDGGDGSDGDLQHGDLLTAEPGGEPALYADGRVPGAGPASIGTTAPASEDEDARARLAFGGRVVDERRAPVAGVEVSLRTGARVLAAATSGADGRYAFSLPAGGRPEGVRAALLGKAPDGRSALTSVWLTVRAGPQQTLPVLVLGRSFDLRVRVAREGAGVLGATVTAVRRGAGVPLLLATAAGDEEGQVTLEGLPAGPVELFATAPTHGRGRLVLRLPRPEDALPATIALQGERVLDVLVVDERDARPIPGATVLVGDARTMPEPHGPGYLPPLPPVRTDRRGHALVRRLGASETVYVNVRASGYAFKPWWRSKSQIAAPTVAQVRVALARRRVVRFPVVEDAVPAPTEGTRLEVDARGVRRDTGGAGVTARMEGGYVVVEGFGVGRSSGTFVAPSGLQARYTLEAGAREGSTVTFRTPRTVRVRVVEPGGTPVPELGLRLRAGGMSPSIAPAVTDAEGRAVFDGVGGGDRVSLHRHVSDQPFGGPTLATLDLAAGIEEHEVVLQPGIAVVLRLRIDGVGRLPADYTVLAAGTRLDPAGIEEDAAAGTLAFTVRPPAADSALRVELHPQGFLAESLEIDPRDSRAEETFDLRPAGRLVVRVTPPDDAEYTLQLQREDGADTWVSARLPRSGAAGVPRQRVLPDPDGTHTYEGLAPGRYRVLERRSRQTSRAVDVGIGARVEMPFDLSGAQWIEGRVVGPPGANLAQARVIVAGRDATASPWSGVRVNADGSFRVRAGRDQPLALRVAHPTLSPAERGGRATVRAAAGAVELRLTHGPELQFRVAGYEKASTPPSGLWHAPLTVYLLPQGDGGPAHAVQPVARDGLFRAGGYAPGTYTLWVAFGREHAPYVRPGLVLGRGTVDLGTIEPPQGAAVRIRIAGLAERPSAALWATVTHEGEPTYARHGALDRAAEELVSRGLGAGRFRVIVRGAGLAAGAPGARVLLDEVVRLDGTSDLTLDLRLP